MNYLQKLFNPNNNVEEIFCLILRQLGVRATDTTVARLLQSHPDYPSLSSVSQVLSTFGIDSLAIHTDDYETLNSTHESFLCQIKTGHGQLLFSYVLSISGQHITWYNPIKHRQETIEKEEFLKLYTGYAMFFDATEKKDEDNYTKHRNQEQKIFLTGILLLLALPLVVFLSLISHFIQPTGAFPISLAVLDLLLLGGCVVGGLLLLYEYNAYTPVLSKICSISRKTNCAAILHSSASSFFGIPWSVIGTAYFLGMLGALVSSDYSLSMLNLAAYIHLLSLPYVCWSVYYQYRMARQWCPLCMGVLAVIVMLFAYYLITGQYNLISMPRIKDISALFLYLFFAFTAIYFLWNYSQQYAGRKRYETSLSRLKLNKEVFLSLLRKEPKIEMPTDEYGIILGNPHGSIHIVKVCNPYCSYCAIAQPVLQQLIKRNSNIKLQMIFTADPDSKYYEDTPIDLFLSLYHAGRDMEAVFSEWYESLQKDKKVFEQKYHTDHRHSEWNHSNAKMMRQFCIDTKVIGTPTIFINGHQLPETYQIKDMLFCF